MTMKVIYGPPGTGKTTYLIREVSRLLEAGVKPESIGYMAFSKDAATEARDRLSGVAGGDQVDCRTLHSCGYRMLGRPPIMEKADQEAIYETWAYLISFDDNGKFKQEDQDMLDRWRSIRRTSSDLHTAMAKLRLEPQLTQTFVQRYEGYKQSTGRIDYEDMVLRALACDPYPYTVLVVDEAQDLNASQIAFVEHLRTRAGRTLVAGDDDQAVMAFQGAHLEWIVSLESIADEVVKLGQSYRIPRTHHELAESVIRRTSIRVEKDYRPRDAEGELLRMRSRRDALEWAAGRKSAAYLGRTGNECSSAIIQAIAAGVPYVAERGAGMRPLQHKGLLAATAALSRLQAGRSITYGEMLDIFGAVATMDGTKALPRGVKADVKRQEPADIVSEEWVTKWGLGDWLGCLARLEGRERYSALNSHGYEHLVYLARVLDANGRPPEHAVVITTIHAAKGREWDRVVLDDTLSPMVAKAMRYGSRQEIDTEHRIAYVGCTRSRDGLLILSAPQCRPNADRYYY